VADRSIESIGATIILKVNGSSSAANLGCISGGGHQSVGIRIFHPIAWINVPPVEAVPLSWLTARVAVGASAVTYATSVTAVPAEPALAARYSPMWMTSSAASPRS